MLKIQECRKHYLQFKNSEKDTLTKLISNNTYVMSPHATIRQTHKVILNREIRDTLKDYKIVEYHYKYGDNRVLIRSNKSYKHTNLCLVLSLNRGEIITVYDNSEDDRHETLDLKNYNRDIDIRNILNN